MEILEWGKYCDAPDGRLNGREEEHRPLGASAGFPRDLQDFCDPHYLGISSDQFEEERERLFENVKHGTGFRPVVTQGRIYSVFYRIGVRPEDPNVPESRPYSLARYFVEPDGGAVSPLTLYQKMPPLRGITRQQAACIDSVHLASQQSKMITSPEPFLRQALVYLISGVSVHVRATEEDFFRLVEEVWSALPVNLRVLLTAGWNVSSSVSEELALCCSAFRSGSCAFYENGRWFSPASSITATTNQLLPGRLYAARLFPSAQSDFEGIAGSLLEDSQIPTLVVDEKLAAIPNFQDLAIKSRFEKAGVSFLQDAALRQLRSWMETGTPTLQSRLPAMVENLQARPELVDLIHEGLGNPLTRERADRLAWFYLRSGKPITGISLSGEISGVHRAALLQATSFKQSKLALQSLLASARAKEADDVPPEIVSVTRDLLTTEEVPIHLALLEERGADTIYLPWAREHAIDLALEFAADPETAAAGTRILEQVCRDNGGVPPALEALARLLSGSAVTLADREALSRLSDSQLLKLGHVLGAIWNRSQQWHLDRILLLNWCAGLPSHLFTNPALILATGGTITREQLLSLVNSGLDTIPASLWPRLSEAALYLFSKLRMEISKERASWMPLIGLWPRELAITLLGVDLATDAQDKTVPFLNAEFRPDADFVQQLIDEWLLDLQPNRVKLLPQASAVIWDWITALKGPKHQEFFALDICRCLGQRQFEEADLAETPNDEVGLAIMLVQISGQREQLGRDARYLWMSARKGWQLRLMLELFPSVSFEPTTDQLAALIPLRAWLRAHLHFNASTERRTRFEIATCDFHEVTFPEKGNKVWRPEWAGTALAGIYRGAPHQDQTSLERALEVYADSCSSKARLCTKYLAAVSQHDFSRAVANVLSEFLLPAAMDGHLKKEEFISVLGSIQEPRQQRNIQIGFEADKPLARLTDGTILVADYIIPLLWLVIRNGYGRPAGEFAAKYYALGR